MRSRLIKRIDRYILGNFIPLLGVTFPICLFVVLMQFLWRYVDELVGKGLSLFVIGEIVFYASMTFVSLALPLGILLASLMTFGNLGERLELLSMKASGMPLYRIMRPIGLFVLALAIGLFIFQNDFMIKSQVKMWTLIKSAKMKAPELEIPEGAFYNAISGFNIYAGHRNRENGRLEDVMIYDYSKGVKNARIIRADSARLAMNVAKDFITWKLYEGESFQNIGDLPPSQDSRPISHTKERFAYKEIVIPFDGQFRKLDEQDMKNAYIGKNVFELSRAIDTAAIRLDSIRRLNQNSVLTADYRQRYSYQRALPSDTSKKASLERSTFAQQEISQEERHRLPSLEEIMQPHLLADSVSLYRGALAQLEAILHELKNRSWGDDESFYYYRTYNQEWHRKFTFPTACIVFFLIGAPLGAIVRKGGIGMPMIVCVLIFILYYVIDTLGYNLSKSGSVPIWLGSWLSVIMLLPLGVYLTITSSRDSATLSLEAYIVYFTRLLGLGRVRKVEYKEIILEETSRELLLEDLGTLEESIAHLEQDPLLKAPFYKIWWEGYHESSLVDSSERLERWVEAATNSQNTLLVVKLSDLPFLPFPLPKIFPRQKLYARLVGLFLPLSLPLSFWAMQHKKRLRRSVLEVVRRLGEAREILEKDENNKE